MSNPFNLNPFSPRLRSAILTALLCLGIALNAKTFRSTELGWVKGQDVTESFEQFLTKGTFKSGDALRLEHTYRLAGNHLLPDNFTLTAVNNAGFDVIDAVDPKSNRALLELGDGTTVRNLTIKYLNTPPLGPTGGKHGVHFTKRIGIEARDKKGLRIENCRLTGSINHHLRFTDCMDIEVVGTHIAGGYWTIMLTGCDKLVFRRCMIEQCQGDGIKTGGGASGAVRNVIVENCVFQDNARDGIDTTGGFNDSVIRNCIFRRLGVSGLDLKSHYESRTGRIEDLAPENIGILVEKCVFHDMPNGLVITTLDCGRRKGPGHELLNASNMKKYAPHDIDIDSCVFGHAEKPLRPASEGGYGVNYPTGKGEHMRMILVKDAYGIRYKDARIFGDRVMLVHVSSIGGSGHLSKEAAGGITLGITGNLLQQPAPALKPGVRKASFVFGPQSMKGE